MTKRKSAIEHHLRILVVVEVVEVALVTKRKRAAEYHLRIATGDGSLATVLPKLHNHTIAPSFGK